jgi:hypothetical protein
MWNLCQQHMRKTSKGVPYWWPDRPERQMGTQGVHRKRGSSLVGSLVLLYRNKIFLSWLGCSSKPNTKYFFLTAQISLYLSPSPSKLGRQSCRVACLINLHICLSWWPRRNVSYLETSLLDYRTPKWGEQWIKVPWENFLMFSEGFLSSSLKWPKNYSGFVWTFVIKRYEACSLSA